MQGIEHAKKTLEGLAELTCDAISIVRKGGGLSAVKKAFEVLSDVKVLIEEAPQALPELADLSGEECAELGASAYVAVKRIVESLKA